MGGFFGAALKKDAVIDVFFGVDYHSHLGTKRAGMAAYCPTIGMQREIHNIENSPFRTKFEGITDEMVGNSSIGCISDSDPQPILIRSKFGVYAITVVGVVNNSKELVDELLNKKGGHFNSMTGGRINSTELIASLITEKDSIVEGIKYAQERIEGSASILILLEDGSLITARDRLGRIPVLIGKRDDGFCVSFESFAFQKLGFEFYRELGPAEIVSVTSDEVVVLSEPREEMKICAFLWSYYGYPTSTYEGVNVEVMRNKNGAIMADSDKAKNLIENIDYVCGVPDSGTPHAIGYANKSDIPFARPFIKYTPTWPRSFMPSNQAERNRVAKMKLIPVHELIEGKKLLFVDDSIVRGTQLRETVDFLYENGAKEVHIRSACPPVMFSCKYLNFSRATSEMELLARKIIYELEGEEGFKYIDEYADSSTERGQKMRDAICKEFHFSSVEYQSLEGLIKSIGIDKCKICTYCWNGKE